MTLIQRSVILHLLDNNWVEDKEYSNCFIKDTRRAQVLSNEVSFYYFNYDKAFSKINLTSIMEEADPFVSYFIEH